MSQKMMLLSATLSSGYGVQGQAWRAPENDTRNLTDVEVQVKLAQTAERGSSRSCSLRTSRGLAGTWRTGPLRPRWIRS